MSDFDFADAPSAKRVTRKPAPSYHGALWVIVLLLLALLSLGVHAHRWHREWSEERLLDDVRRRIAEQERQQQRVERLVRETDRLQREIDSLQVAP